ncbi:MAG TPA: DUF4139 domain-containing protein [Candidatus Bathyarchaeia archaeon]|nr:DUF4139 domain-containing protein [Candidatus Bathyarchaeia archaeon]
MRSSILAVLLLLASSCAWAQPPPAPAAPATETTIADQVDVAVTAYTAGLALVRDSRKLSLPTGEIDLRFSDVAQQIRPETVSLRSVSAPGSVAVIEQNYEFDLISPAKLMEKYVGKKVALVNFSKEIGFERVEAELMSVNQGPIYRVGGEIFLGHPGNVVLPQIPENLIARPSLIWRLANEAAEQTVEAAYLTGGIGWKADYVITLARDEQSLGLNGWVTLTNQCGATFNNAMVKLVAGEVNLAPQPRVMMQLDYAARPAAEAPAMPREEAFGEYHLYTLPRRTTIRQNQTKQVALLAAEGVKAGKRYEFRGQEFYYMQIIPPEDRNEPVAVFLEFRNEAGNNLGIPLPGGVMRVYQEDQDGMLQFSGEDSIKHTPKDEKVSLRLGNAFDVKGERIQTDFRQIAQKVTESAYKITLRNHKQQDIVVEVVEPVPGDWEVLESSHEYEKKDARTILFKVPVPKDGEVKVEYRVRVRY